VEAACKNCGNIEEIRGQELCKKCYLAYLSTLDRIEKRRIVNKESRDRCIITCKKCGNTRRHAALGLCGACYNQVQFKRHPGKRMQYVRKSLYGQEATTKFYAAVKAQGGKCIICNKKKQLVLDHNHETDQFRGAICHRCNAGMGLFNDDPQLLQKVLDYLTVSDVETNIPCKSE